ncbi:N-acetyltransferase eso1 [Diplonema papillatum]|nr:N-acetyltransferase eso1 [Diplonema papillatum]
MTTPSAAAPRAVVHIDLDCFYAQVEMVRLGVPPDHPYVLVQWGGLIAVNYPARAFGIKRFGTSLADARRACPQLRWSHAPTYLVGESAWAYHENPSPKTHKISLDPYRAASQRIFAVLRRFGGVVVEKGGVDEAFLDVTAAAKARLASIRSTLGRNAAGHDSPAALGDDADQSPPSRGSDGDGDGYGVRPLWSSRHTMQDETDRLAPLALSEARNAGSVPRGSAGSVLVPLDGDGFTRRAPGSAFAGSDSVDLLGPAALSQARDSGALRPGPAPGAASFEHLLAPAARSGGELSGSAGTVAGENRPPCGGGGTDRALQDSADLLAPACPEARSAVAGALQDSAMTVACRDRSPRDGEVDVDGTRQRRTEQDSADLLALARPEVRSAAAGAGALSDSAMTVARTDRPPRDGEAAVDGTRPRRTEQDSADLLAPCLPKDRSATALLGADAICTPRGALPDSKEAHGESAASFDEVVRKISPESASFVIGGRPEVLGRCAQQEDDLLAPCLPEDRNAFALPELGAGATFTPRGVFPDTKEARGESVSFDEVVRRISPESASFVIGERPEVLGRFAQRGDELYTGTETGDLAGQEGEWELLAAACGVVWEMRAAIDRELGYKASAGISHNKLLSKAISASHKPNRQAVLCRHRTRHFLCDVPLAKLRAFGGKLGARVRTSLAAEACGDAWRHSLHDFRRLLSAADDAPTKRAAGGAAKMRDAALQSRRPAEEDLGCWVYRRCRGYCDAAVEDKTTTKSLLAQKAFAPLTRDLSVVKQWCDVLSLELERRVLQYTAEQRHRPVRLSVKFGQHGLRRSGDLLHKTLLLPWPPKSAKISAAVVGQARAAFARNEHCGINCILIGAHDMRPSDDVSVADGAPPSCRTRSSQYVNRQTTLSQVFTRRPGGANGSPPSICERRTIDVNALPDSPPDGPDGAGTWTRAPSPPPSDDARLFPPSSPSSGASEPPPDPLRAPTPRGPLAPPAGAGGGGVEKVGARRAGRVATPRVGRVRDAPAAAAPGEWRERARKKRKVGPRGVPDVVVISDDDSRVIVVD